MTQAKYEVHQGADGHWYWRLVAPNGRIVAQGEGYRRKSGACQGLAAHRRHAATMRVLVKG